MNKTQMENETLTTNKREKILENFQYPILALLVIGQIIIGKWYLVGQIVYLIADCLSCIRCFGLKRPTPDKVKEITFIAITTALIFCRIF